MKENFFYQYRRALLSFMALLLVFLIVADVLIVSMQREQLTDKILGNMQGELDLIGTFVREPLLRHDYAKVEQFLMQWAEEHKGVIAFTALMPNNFVLMEYRRDEPAAKTYVLQQQVTYSGRNLITLELTRDAEPEENILSLLQLQLVGGSVLLTGLLGIVLWRSMRKILLNPMEREVAVRKQAEEMLQKAKNQLEGQVMVRTKELKEMNEKLHAEIDERKKAEKVLRFSEEKFSKAFRSSPTFITISTLEEGRYIDVNDAFLDASGYTREELIGCSALELGIWVRPSERNQMLQQLLEHGAVHNTETELRMKNGAALTVLYSAELIEIEGKRCILSVKLDITERKELEAQLLQAQKMEAVGQLAGGVAHDFNNILTAIISNSYLLKNRIGEGGEARGFVDKIITLSNNAAKTVQELLLFSRKQKVEMTSVLLNDIVKGAKNLLTDFIGEKTDLVIELSGKDLSIMADKNQLEQVIINLATNARDVMTDGGTLILKTGSVEIDSDFINTHGFGRPGMYALLTAVDSGTGMDDETVQKIFEPFFSTKEVGKGTGLGLSIIYGIIKQHKGFISVDSEPGKGTTFRIYLPVTEMIHAQGASNTSKKLTKE